LRIVAALAVIAALGGCGDMGLDASQPWFRKQLDLTGQAGGYTFSDLQESRRDRPLTANDLVETNGSCPPAQAQPGPSIQNASPAAAPMVAPDSTSLVDEGIALGMTECEVVHRAGAPSNIELGKNPNGDRTAVLTYQSGPRPGIYHFERGRLMEMDSVAGSTPPPEAAKKKPAKPKKPSNNAA
jgi:hypothetical protein